jgi:hypothetical protein
MNQERRETLDPRIRSALTELEDAITQHYPTARFEVSRGHDEPENIHLTAIVDVEDTDQVLELVIDRVVDLQVEEGLPIHVIPIRTPEQVLAALERERPKRHARQTRTVPLVGRTL